MIAAKPGVRWAGVQPQIIWALAVCADVWHEDGCPLTVTSVNDGRHSHTSLHYAGAAVDLRTRDIRDPEGKCRRLRDRLGRDFDVLNEGDHIHLEYQPRSSV